MNLVKKIIIALSVVVGSPVAAGIISLDSMLNGAHDEVSVRKALLEAVVQYGKVVLYFGADLCNRCKDTKKAILELISQFPDVIFVMADIKKYPFLKNGTIPKVRFHKNGAFLEETGSLNKVRLKALLNQYYR